MSSNPILRRIPPHIKPRPIRLPANPPNVGPVDVVTPFSRGDEQYLPESVAASLDQPGCEPCLHLIADGFTPSPETVALADDPRVRLYVNERNVGPYVSAMATFPYHVSDWYAVSDADDLDTPGRFWEAITHLRGYDADLFGAAMDQFADAGHERSVVDAVRAPYHVSGSVWTCAPLGTCVHTTCTFRRSSFERIGGYRSLFCAADVEINTRARFAGWRFVISSAIHGHRRLRDDSLSRGGEWQVGKPKRVEMEKVLAEDYARWTTQGCDAPSYGGLSEVLADATVCIPWGAE